MALLALSGWWRHDDGTAAPVTCRTSSFMLVHCRARCPLLAVHSPNSLLARRAGEQAHSDTSRDTSAWKESKAEIMERVSDCNEEDADMWLQDGYGWSRKSKRFWRKSRSQAEPIPQDVAQVLDWLQTRNLAKKAWVSKFPTIMGLTIKDLEDAQKTAPSYLKKDDVFLKAISANPQLLGNNFDCLAEHESCQGFCSRCWNT